MVGAAPLSPTVLDALRDGLARHCGEVPRQIAVDRRITRAYSEVAFCTATFAAQAPLQLVAKQVSGPASDMARQQVLMARDYTVNQHLYASMAHQPLTVPEPLMFRPDLNLIVTRLCEGERLQERLIEVGRGWPSAAALEALARDCEACGAWLRAFQAATRDLVAAAGFGASLDAVDARACVQQSQVCLDSAARCGQSPFDGAEQRELLDYLEQRARRIGGTDADFVGVHGDFFAGNVLRSRERTVGIDFVMFRKGLPLADVTYFVLQLETLGRRPGMRGPTVQHLVRAFLRGYDTRLDVGRFWQSCPVTQSMYVLHRVRRLWGMVSPDRAWHRVLARRLQAAHIRQQLLRHVRQTDAAKVT
jgi:Ser/Thr protein kinase RdoA (MazF antagonist)